MTRIRDFLAFVGFARRALAAVFACSSSAFAAGLNDTGQTQCYDAANALVPCSAAVGGDAGINPRQDGRYGRDAADAAGRFLKVGAGSAGFDYSKIANNGYSIAANAPLGSAATDWACTKDNVTGLVWEIKTSGGLRGIGYAYNWYSTDFATNGGVSGVSAFDDFTDVSLNSCRGSLAAPPYNNQCNTHNFVTAVNVVGLCGAHDWRLPSQREVLTLIHAGKSPPAFDATHFPASMSIGCVWTKTTYAPDPAFAWFVDFTYGRVGKTLAKTQNNCYVMLVRGG